MQQRGGASKVSPRKDRKVLGELELNRSAKESSPVSCPACNAKQGKQVKSNRHFTGVLVQGMFDQLEMADLHFFVDENLPDEAYYLYYLCRCGLTSGSISKNAIL